MTQHISSPSPSPSSASASVDGVPRSRSAIPPRASASGSWQPRLYQDYAAHHAGLGNRRAARLAFRRNILPHLPADLGASILDIGCGQGDMVAQCHAHGYTNASGIDVSAQQVEIARSRGVQGIRIGDAGSALAAAAATGGLDAVLATDVLEHLPKPEVVALLDRLVVALRPGGVLVARMPNAVSPMSGHIQHGDFTHETAFTARSIRQVANLAGFSSTTVRPSPPPVYNLVSLVRRGLWTMISGLYTFALVVETGRPKHVVTLNMVVVARR